MTPQIPQQSKEQVALQIVTIAIQKGWIKITTYNEFLKAVAEATYALVGQLRKVTPEQESD